MQAHYPFAFEREMGCTAEELCTWLPGACGKCPIDWREQGVEVATDGGTVRIAWLPLEPRRIAQIAVPRLRVRFDARDVDAAVWQRFMRHFDLFTQRGGG